MATSLSLTLLYVPPLSPPFDSREFFFSFFFFALTNAISLGQVQWCTNVPFGNQGLQNSFVLMMKYKGEAASFTPLASHYQGGLREYCYTAMQWALQNCKHGGYFENHKIGAASVDWQYWDAKVDPNSGSCAQNN